MMLNPLILLATFATATAFQVPYPNVHDRSSCWPSTSRCRPPSSFIGSPCTLPWSSTTTSESSRIIKLYSVNTEEEETETTIQDDEVNNDSTNNDINNNGLVFDLTQEWKETKESTTEFWNRLFSKRADDENKDNIFNDSMFPDSSEGSNANDHDEKDDETNDDNGNGIDIESALLEPLKQLRKIDHSDDNNNDNDDNTSDNDSNTGGQDGVSSFQNVLKQASSLQEETAKRWMQYFSSNQGGTEQSIRDMVDTARQSAEEDGDVTDKKSFQEVLSLLQKYGVKLKGNAKEYFGDMDLSQLYPTSLFYFMEREDEVKNPSWKRRMHRYYPGVGIDRMNHLNDALALARVSYMDSVEEAKERLANLTEPYELVFCDLKGETNKPAHFIALKKNQQPLSPALEVVLGIRGTKTITDAITDLLFKYADYRGGKAHSGMLDSGVYVADKQKPLLRELLESSGKSRIKLQLVGHSLGAGAASIAAMEFNDEPDFDVAAVGFGSPAMLSQDLSESIEDQMTTVVADDDIVPRLSVPTVVNALLDIMEFDYVPSAKRDIEHAFDEFQRLYPMIVTEDRAEKIMDLLDPLLEEHLSSGIKNATTDRMVPDLFPPGKIVHFYRDGVGISGNIVPCTKFDQIDLKRRMIDDHLFHSGYEQIFLDVMRLHFKDQSFQFENPVSPAED